MTAIHFTSSDNFIARDARAVERTVVPIEGYVEGTYEALRSGPAGREIARLVKGAWQLPGGDRFSDWSVSATP